MNRLSRIRSFSYMCIALAALLLVADLLIPVSKLTLQQYLWFRQYIHGNWAVAGLLGGLILLYTEFRIDQEKKKSNF